jgi:hypothetical protein
VSDIAPLAIDPRPSQTPSHRSLPSLPSLSSRPFLASAAVPLLPASANIPSSGADEAVSAALPDFALFGQFGSDLTQPMTLAYDIVNAFANTRQMTHGHMRQLRGAIENALQIARQSQQLARLAKGRLRQAHEHMRLDELLQDALVERADHLESRGVAVVRNIKPVEVVVDPSLLATLIDTALGWAASDGQRLVVSLGIKNWPEHGILALRTSGLSKAGAEALAADSLTWQLMAHTALTMGVTLEREVTGTDATLLMEFARTVKQFDGLTAVEMDVSGDSTLHNGTKPMAGMRILLISNDSFVKSEVENAGHLLNVQVDSVPNIEKAQSHLRMGLPHLIVIDERLRDDRFEAMQAEIRGIEPNFGFLEIADQFNTFEVSSWMSDSMTRVSRDVLRAQLPSVLMLELARSQ